MSTALVLSESPRTGGNTDGCVGIPGHPTHQRWMEDGNASPAKPLHQSLLKMSCIYDSKADFARKPITIEENIFAIGEDNHWEHVQSYLFRGGDVSWLVDAGIGDLQTIVNQLTKSSIRQGIAPVVFAFLSKTEGC